MASIREQLQPKVEAATPPTQPPEAAPTTDPTPASKYKVKFGGLRPESSQETQDTLGRLFPGKSHEEVAAITGAPEGSKINFRSHGDNLDVHVNHMDHPDHYAHYTIHPHTDTGELMMHVNRFDNKGAKGTFHKQLNNIVNNAASLGVNKLTAVGSSDPHPITNEKDNGGYSWPRIGFNGELPHSVFSKLSPDLQSKIDSSGARDYHTLFNVGGADELKDKHDSTGHLEFDLNPHSPHRKALDAYHNTRELQRLSTPRTNEGRGLSTGQTVSGSNQTSPVNSKPQTPQTTSTEGVGGTLQQPSTQNDFASRRTSRLNRIQNLGKFKRTAKEIVAKYGLNPQKLPTEAYKPVAPPISPLVKGTQLEHVLTHLKGTASSLQTQQLAAKALAPAPADVHHGKHLHDTIQQLHASLQNENHPLASRFNWDKVATGTVLEHTLHHAATIVGKRYPGLDPRAAKQKALEDMSEHHFNQKRVHPAAEEAMKTVLEVANPENDDLVHAFERTYLQTRLAKTNPSGSKFKQIALNYGIHEVPPGTDTALRFTRTIGGIDFQSALDRVHSTLGATLEKVAATIHEKLKLHPTKTHKAVHDSKEGSMANTVQSIYHDDPDKVTSAAAHYGLLTETPSMVVFRAGEGPDSIHHFTVNGSGEKLRSQMDTAGLNQRNMIPTKTGYHVIVFDPESKQTKAIQQFVNSLGTTVNTQKGMSEHIGGDAPGVKADKEARRNYRAIIREESQQGGVK